MSKVRTKKEKVSKDMPPKLEAVASPVEGPGKPAAPTAIDTKIKMTREEIDKYIDQLMKDGNPLMSEFETEALARTRETSQRLDQMTRRLGQVRAEAAQLDDDVKQHRGQMDAFITMLVSAEDKRRSGK